MSKNLITFTQLANQSFEDQSELNLTSVENNDCGLNASSCTNNTQQINGNFTFDATKHRLALAFLFFVVISTILFVRKKMRNVEVNNNLIIKSDDIETGQSFECMPVYSKSQESQLRKSTAKINGEAIFLKAIDCDGLTSLKCKTIEHLGEMHELRHENVNIFIGFCDSLNGFAARQALAWQFCYRGSLADVLRNNKIKLDWHFRLSFLNDLVKGMRHLHNSPIKCHGWLTSRNCVIDNRWMLKITDYGVNRFYELQSLKLTKKIDDFIWTAPELLKQINFKDQIQIKKTIGSRQGDVYSFAVIMHEVITRQGPFGMESLNLTANEVIRRLCNPFPIFRPNVSNNLAPTEFVKLMEICWCEDPNTRPSFNEIFDQIKKFSGERKVNFIDTMLSMLEGYSVNLEEMVKERTDFLEEERLKTDVLLNRMLPLAVSNSLKSGLPVHPEKFEEVTLSFADIVGFTTISAYSEPIEIVTFLNDLYTAFDDIIERFKVFKVETIGDAYMIVSGLPERNGDHAEQIATVALEFMHVCVHFKISHMPTIPLKIRCGIHTGPVVTGVVGTTNPRFCLFGDTVNTASRLESTGCAYRIHISKSTEKLLSQAGGYQIKYRGEIALKGRGKQPTFWLINKKGFDKLLPQPEENEDESHGIEEDIFTVLGREKNSDTK